MKFKFDPKTGRMVGSKTQILQRQEIERLGGIFPEKGHINPGTAYIPDKDLMKVKAAANRDGVDLTRLNGWDKDIGGNLYRFERTITLRESEERRELEIDSIEDTGLEQHSISGVRKLFSIKFTLDGTDTKETNIWGNDKDEAIDKLLDRYGYQAIRIKGAMKDCKFQVNEGPGAGYTVHMKHIKVTSAKAKLTNGQWCVEGTCTFEGSAEGYDWTSEEKEYTGNFEFDVTTAQIEAYVRKYLLDWNPKATDDENKEMLERIDAYSIDDLERVIGAGWSHVEWDGLLDVGHGGFDLDDKYLNGHDAEVGNFDIQLFETDGSDSTGTGLCYFGIDCDAFAQDVESAYQTKDDDAVSEDAGKYIDDWLMPDQLTDDEFTDFTYFVDKYTGTEAYSNYEQKMPEKLFDEVYAAWLKDWNAKHPESDDR